MDTGFGTKRDRRFIPTQHPVPPTYPWEQMEDSVLTFRGSPLFGLQGREGTHDGPHGSEDLCATWDAWPCLLPPLKRNRCGLPTLNWRRGKARKQKAPGSSPAAWYSESVGPGRLELVAAAFFSQAHALTPRARSSRELSQAPPGAGTQPGHWPLRGPSPEPQSLPDVGHGAGVPARPRLPSPRRVRCGSCAPPARPCYHPAAPPRAQTGSQGTEYQS